MPEVENQIKVVPMSRVLVILALIIFVISGVFWWRNVHLGANNVFWGMVENNLSSSSVTRRVVRSSGGQSIDQYIRTQFGPLTAAESLVALKQTDKNGDSIVRSDTIGTQDAIYNRYIGITTPDKNSKGKSIDSSSVLGIWGKAATQDSQNSSQYFQQSFLTILPFGNFNQEQRQSLINQMHSHNIYSFSAQTTKSDKVNGRAVYVYSVDISPAAYVELMQAYTHYLGFGDLGLDPSAYASSPPLSAEFTVDKLSRQLVKISYPTTGQTETYEDQGLDSPIKLPTATIPLSELQSKIQKIVQ